MPQSRRDPKQLGVAREKLRVFLDQLDPLLRRYLLDDLTVEDARSWLNLPADRRAEWDRAVIEHNRLVSLIPEERARFRRKHGQAHATVALQPRRRGAPSKAPEGRQDVQIAADVEKARTRLESGWNLSKQRRTAGGFDSDPESVRAALQDAGYDPDETRAIQKGRTLSGAAAHLVAWRRGCDVSVIHAFVSRVKKLLRRPSRTIR